MPDVMACGVNFALVKAAFTSPAREGEIPIALQDVPAGAALAINGKSKRALMIGEYMSVVPLM